jgi:Tfp pilus assembly protein PilF
VPVVSLLSLALLLTVLPARANQYSFRADLTCARCTSYSNIIAELTDSARYPIASGPVGQNGVVQLYAPREGVFIFTVRTMQGDILHQEPVQVGKYNSAVSIHIDGGGNGEAPERPVSGTISVARLQHKPVKQAKKEYIKAEDKLRAGDLRASLEHLKNAVQIDPNYMEAYNNLGSRYMMLGDLPSAQTAFQRALALDPDAHPVQVNLSIVLLAMGDAKGAEVASRRAVRLNPSDMKAKYMLGLSLYQQHAFTEETVDLLSKAREKFPSATMALAVIHANSGELQLARESLKEYIRSGEGEHKAKAEQMLASLK